MSPYFKNCLLARAAGVQRLCACSKRRQGGAALISVMLVMSIAVVLAAQEMRQAATAITNSKASSMAAQGYWYARAGETLGRQILAEDWKLDQQNAELSASSDHLAEAWAQPFTSLGLEDGALQLQILDLQSRFNVNNLRSKNPDNRQLAEQTLQRICSSVGVSESSFAILRANLEQQAWVDLSELRGLLALSNEQYKDLQAMLVALPAADVALNINTASEPLLHALYGDLNDELVRKTIKQREREPITQLSGSEASMNLSTSTKLGVRSEFFDIQSAAGFLSLRSYLSTKVHRASDGRISIIARSHGKHVITTELDDDILVTAR